MRVQPIALTALILSGVAFSGSAGADSMAAIVAHPQKYDGQVVTVTGSVTGIRERVSKRGNPYETLNVCAKACLKVFTFGHPPITDAEHVTVTGTFAAVKRVGRYTFYNEIDTQSSGIQMAAQ